jgi:hypothetical protein
MSSRLVKLWVWCALALVSGSAAAAVDYGTYTLVEGGARLLRGAVWYKLVPGVAAEDGDIVEAPERAQVQLEAGTGSKVNLVGPAMLYLVPGKGGPSVLGLRTGWLKVAARGTGVRVRTLPLDLVVAEGTLVVRAQGPAVELFVEGGGARLVELTAAGGDGAARDAKRGEYWSKATGGAFATVPRAPRAFVAAMPRHFVDPLPALAGRARAKPTLVVDHEITFAEAEPWLVGRDRAVFERRFAVRLRDPAFRKAADANIARYPAWDRMLHPEKYEPKPKPAP